MTSEWGEDDKRVEGGWKVGRESDVGWRRVGVVGLGHRARQDFARGMHRHGALSLDTATGYHHRVLPQSTGTGHQSQDDQSQGTSHRILARSTDMGL